MKGHHPGPIGSPVDLSETPADVRSPALLLGEHTEEVLKGVLNLTPAEVLSLKEERAIG